MKSAEKIGEEIRKWYRRDYPGMPVRNGTAGTEGTARTSMRGELKRGLSLNRKTLNRKVRHQGKDALQHGDYKRVCRTLRMVDFT